MRRSEVADFLENYNKWRRGSDDVKMPKPEELGKVLDLAIKMLRTRFELFEIKEMNDD